jgi:enoyl-CoA hydratase/carnithine racemase
VTDYQTIRYERDGDIGTLTLARPEKRNAQNPLMWRELADLGAVLLADQTLRCLIMTGQGPSFSAGIDLVEGLGGLVAGRHVQLASRTRLSQHRRRPRSRARRRVAARARVRLPCVRR